MGGACDRLFSIPPMFCFECLHDSVINPRHWSPSACMELFLLHFVSSFFWPNRNLAMKNPQNHPAAPHLARWPSRWSRPSWAFWVSASLIPCMALIRDSWAARSGRSGLPRWPCQVCQVYQDGWMWTLRDSPITLGKNHGEFLHFPHRRYQFEGAPPFADKPISKISWVIFKG